MPVLVDEGHHRLPDEVEAQGDDHYQYSNSCSNQQPGTEAKHHVGPGGH